MENNLFKIKPLGGVGQIGSNMTLIECAGERIVIDCGILFPYEDYFDINYLIPNLEKEAAFDAIIFTHGHEDHIGAVQHFVQHSPNATIYAGDFTAALIRKKLSQANIPHGITVFDYNETLNFNGFSVDPIHVNHSIPETMGLVIKDHQKHFSVFFASDFKIDFKTQYEKPFDFEKLKRISADVQKKVFMVDSTNILSNNLNTPSEWDLRDSFEEVFKNLTDRLFITCFSSNIHRLKTIIDIAEKYEFKIVPHGRSIISYLGIAKEKGMIPNYDAVVRTPDQVQKDQKNLCVILTGCQGDFLGTLRRVSMGEDSQFKLKKADKVIFSSKPIPGNEKKVAMIMNKISEAGAEIVLDKDKTFHVSGHPGKSDLLRIFQEYAPHLIIPIHGESLFLHEHCEFINASFPQAESLLIENFDELFFMENLEVKKSAGEKLEPVIIHGKNIPIEREYISERRKISCNGGVFITITKSSKTNKVDHFTYDTLGLPDYFHNNEEQFKTFLQGFFDLNKVNDPEKFKEELRIGIRRYCDAQIGYKPSTIVHIIV